MVKYVIVGASAAGIQAAEELRRLDEQAEITVVSAEKHYPYSRCLISRFVERKLPLEGLAFRTGHFFEDWRVRGILNTTVARIDREQAQIHGANGLVLPYDKLLLATGARPATPRIPGADLGNVFTFHTLEDAERITAAAESAAYAVVLGGGFAGLEAAYALARTGVKVTVVEKAGQILPNQLDLMGSRVIHDDLRSSGVSILLDSSVSAMQPNPSAPERVGHVTLTDHSVVRADLVVLATGVRPNKELAEAAGLVVQRGIEVNPYMQTSDPAIYAAGDVIEIEDAVTGKRATSATWFNAILQGRYAAYNMAGHRRPYTEAVGIQNAVQFHHVPAISFGQTLVTSEDEDCEVMTLQKPGLYKKLVLRGNRLYGMIFVGDIAKAGFYAALIRHHIDVSPFRDKLLDSDFSYAYLLNRHDLGQKSPYGATAPEWESPTFWAQRPQSVGIAR